VHDPQHSGDGRACDFIHSLPGHHAGVGIAQHEEQEPVDYTRQVEEDEQRADQRHAIEIGAAGERGALGQAFGIVAAGHTLDCPPVQRPYRRADCEQA